MNREKAPAPVCCFFYKNLERVKSRLASLIVLHINLLRKMKHDKPI